MGHPTSETKQDTECRWLINYAPADAETEDQLSGWLTKAYPVTDDDRWASLDPRTQIELKNLRTRWLVKSADKSIPIPSTKPGSGTTRTPTGTGFSLPAPNPKRPVGNEGDEGDEGVFTMDI